MTSGPASPDRLEQGLRDGRSRGQGVETSGQGSDPWGAYLQQQQQARQQAVQQAQQYVGMQAHACQFPPVPAGGIDSELSSLSGGMAGRQAGIGAVSAGACGTQSAVPVHGCLGQGMAGQDVLVQMQQLISMMSPQQAQAAQTALQEQLGMQARGVPEQFGPVPVPVGPRREQFMPQTSGVLPGAGMQAGMTQSFESRDVFSRSEKWLGQPPVTHAEKWSTREQEVAGFADYVVSLQSWAALASVVFAEEIGMCVRWPDTIWQHSLNEEQKTRSVRLYGLLKAAFLDHARATLMIQAFSEGLPLDGSLADPARSLGNVNCGYELLRQLAQQFSLRSRAEALSMRSELLHRIFAFEKFRNECSYDGW